MGDSLTITDNEPDEFLVEVGDDISLGEIAEEIVDLEKSMHEGTLTRDEVAQLRAAATAALAKLAEHDAGVTARRDGAKSQGRVAFGRPLEDEAGIGLFVRAQDIPGIAEEYRIWKEEHDQ